MNTINDKIIKDYLAGKATDKEMEQLAEWMELSDENRKMVFDAELAYHLGKPNPLATRQKMEEAETILFDKIDDNKQVKRHINLHRYLRYAAVLLVTLVAGGGLLAHFLSTNRTVTVAALDDVKQITLPDHSTVWLNKGASISYPEDFEGDERKVNIKGEALFHVTKNPDKPFIVSSQGASARVLGTTFNFNEHGKSGNEEISLIEGRLEVTGQHGEGKVILSPNQKATINKAGKAIKLENEYAPLEAVWRDNMIPFTNMHITQIAQILEQLYGDKITIDPKLDRQKTYTGVIKKSKDIRTVLEGLSYTISFRYTIDKGKIILSAY
ncbi:MAG: FecR domain-containing protein [Prevotella sp.]|nr:FecR domain-containing protein [Prevotella sp.]